MCVGCASSTSHENRQIHYKIRDPGRFLQKPHGTVGTSLRNQASTQQKPGFCHQSAALSIDWLFTFLFLSCTFVFWSRTAECAGTFEEHSSKVWCIDVCGKRMISGGADSKICPLGIHMLDVGMVPLRCYWADVSHIHIICNTYECKFILYIHIYIYINIYILTYIYIYNIHTFFSYALEEPKTQFGSYFHSDAQYQGTNFPRKDGVKPLKSRIFKRRIFFTAGDCEP